MAGQCNEDDEWPTDKSSTKAVPTREKKQKKVQDNMDTSLEEELGAVGLKWETVDNIAKGR